MVFRYEAGWDSTFLTTEHVRRVIDIARPRGDRLCSAGHGAEVGALRWSASAKGGVNAALDLPHCRNSCCTSSLATASRAVCRLAPRARRNS
jgi:hypothetical protein